MTNPAPDMILRRWRIDIDQSFDHHARYISDVHTPVLAATRFAEPDVPDFEEFER